MPNASPLVTVLLPVCNGAAHLQASLESILGQTFTDFELLVIDDGSTDCSAEILRAVRDPRLRLVTHPRNLGLVPTLNEGLALARGELIARQDHDDLSHPERLQKQATYLRANPECALIGSQALQIGEDGRPALPLFRPLNAECIRWYLCFDNAFIHSSVMFRRAVIQDEFGGYPASFYSEDYALWSAIARQHAIANLPEPLLHYREHAGSMTGSINLEVAAAFDGATGEIRRENLEVLFGGDEAVSQHARLLSTYRRPFTAQSAAAFFEVFDRYRKRYSEVVQNPEEYRRVCASQLAELAYRLLPLARSRAGNLYRRALALSPSLARELPWARLGALFFLGENARHLYQRFISRR